VTKPRKETQHHDERVATDEQTKPKIIQYYNSTKSGVNVPEKLVCTYSCKCAIARWTMAFFWNMIILAAYNALVLWFTRNQQWNEDLLPGESFCMQLVSSHADEHVSLPSIKRWRIQQAARRSGVSEMEPSHPSQRCMCPRRPDLKTSRACDSCGSFLCKQHSEMITS